MQRRRASREEQSDAPAHELLARIPSLLSPNDGWFITHDEPEDPPVGAVLLQPGLAIGKLEIGVTPEAAGTRVRLGLTYTAMSEKGNALFDERLDGRIQQMLGALMSALRGRDPGTARLHLPSGPLSRAADGRSFQPVTTKVFEHRVIIHRDTDACFALACPVAELDWIDGWEFDLLYSDTGHNEDDCMFLEGMLGLAVLCVPGSTTCWYTTLHDVPRHRFHAVQLVGDLVLGRSAVEMRDLGDGATEVCSRVMFTGLSERGNRLVLERGIEKKAGAMLRFLMTSMKVHAETGKVFRVPVQQKVGIALSMVSAMLRRHVHGRMHRTEPAR